MLCKNRIYLFQIHIVLFEKKDGAGTTAWGSIFDNCLIGIAMIALCTGPRARFRSMYTVQVYVQVRATRLYGKCIHEQSGIPRIITSNCKHQDSCTRSVHIQSQNGPHRGSNRRPSHPSSSDLFIVLTLISDNWQSLIQIWIDKVNNSINAM